jgi:lysophospholipase L1-like esterase
VSRRLIVALTAVVVVTASCSLIGLAPFRLVGSKGPGPRVLAIGDSNLAYAGPALGRALGNDKATIDGRPTITTNDPRWAGWLRTDLAAGRPEVVVVQLGTNDAYASRAAAFPAALDRIMRALPRGVPVLWCDVRIISGVGREWTDPQWAVDAAIFRAAARWPDLHVLDYAGHFARHPEWVSPSAVHLKPAGDVEYARWIGSQVARFTR